MVKRLVLTLMLPALLAAPLASPKPAEASVAISISYFHDSLEPYGNWIDYSAYGRCWVPHVSAGWRPYSNGHWAYTDFGWTWVAYEPWGWAPFHYGRWVFDPFYGWVWVPGTVWAPAWVAWRHYDSWVGWAPLPPVSGWQTSFVYSYSSVVVEQIPAERWCFVSTTHLLDRDVDRRLVSVRRNAGLIERSRNVTRFANLGGTPANLGLDVRKFERETGRNVPRLRAIAAQSPTGGRGQKVGADGLAFFRPQVRKGDGVSRAVDRVTAREQRRPSRSVQERRMVEERRPSRSVQVRREVGSGRMLERRAARQGIESKRPARAQSLRSRPEASERRAPAMDRGRAGIRTNRLESGRGRSDRTRFDRNVIERRAPAMDRGRAGIRTNRLESGPGRSERSRFERNVVERRPAREERGSLQRRAGDSPARGERASEKQSGRGQKGGRHAG